MYHPNGQVYLWPHMSGLQPDYFPEDSFSPSHYSPHLSSPQPNPFYSPLQPVQTQYPVDHFSPSTTLPSCRIETVDEIQDSVYVDTFAYLPGPNPFNPPQLQRTAVHHFEYQMPKQQEVEAGKVEPTVVIEEIDSRIWCDGEQKEDQEDSACEVSEIVEPSKFEDSTVSIDSNRPSLPLPPAKRFKSLGAPEAARSRYSLRSTRVRFLREAGLQPMKKSVLNEEASSSSSSTSRPSSSRPSLLLPPAKRFKSLGAPETARPSRYSLRSTRVRFLREAGVKPMKKSVLNEEAFGRKRF